MRFAQHAVAAIWVILSLLLVGLNSEAQQQDSLVRFNAGLPPGEFCFYGSGQYETPGYVVSVVVSDLDDDEDVDVAAVTHTGDVVSVFKNNGDGTFSDAWNYGAGNTPWSICAADFDGDTHVDLATGGNVVAVLMNNGSGGFSAPTHYSFYAPTVVAADFNRDGRIDIAGGESPLYVLINNGNGTFSDAVVYPFAADHGLQAADFDGDEFPDLAALSGGYVTVLENNQDGTFSELDGIPCCGGFFGFPNSLFAANLDGDNDIDLAVACEWFEFESSIAVLLNDGDGTFDGPTVYAAALPDGIFGADFDRDGDVDLAAASGGIVGALEVFPNRGDGTFESGVEFGAGLSPVGGAAADFDGDGDDDVALAGQGLGISIVLNCFLFIPPLSLPANGSTIGDDPVFRWIDRVNYEDYLLEYSEVEDTAADGRFVYPYASFEVIGQREFRPQQGFLSIPGLYYWHVSRLVGDEPQGFSEIWSFVVPQGDGITNVDVVTAYDCATFTVTPQAEYEVAVYSGGYRLQACWIDSALGYCALCGFESGMYNFEVENSEGSVVFRDSFVIVAENQPPVFDLVAILPDSVASNNGTDSALFVVRAHDPEGTVDSVVLDLSQIGGPTPQVPNPVLSDSFVFRFSIPDSAHVGNYRLPVRAYDDLGLTSDSAFALSIASDHDTVQTIGVLTVFAEGFTTIDEHRIEGSGNVRIANLATNCELLIDSEGSVELDFTPGALSVKSSGVVNVSANLPLLGMIDLYRGQFEIDSAGVSAETVSNYLLDELAGFFIDSMATIDVDLGATPSISGSLTLLVDCWDGVLDNDTPMVEFTFGIDFDGNVSGSMTATEPLTLATLPFGRLTIDSLRWENTLMRVNAASVIADSLLGFDTLTISPLELSPEGISLGTLTVANWSFDYCGFNVDVHNAELSSEYLEMDVELKFGEDVTLAEVQIDDLRYADGQLSLSGGRFNLADLQIQNYRVGNVGGEFGHDCDTLADTCYYYLGAHAKVTFPHFATIGLDCRFQDNCPYLVRRFYGLWEAEGSNGIPIGNTGLMLAGLGGGAAAENEDCTGWTIMIDPTIRSVVKVAGKHVIDGGFKATIYSDSVSVDGDVSFAGTAKGDLHASLSRRAMAGNCFIYIPDKNSPWLDCYLEFVLSGGSRPTLTGRGEGDLTIPAEHNPLWGEPIELGYGTFTVDEAGFASKVNMRDVLNLSVLVDWEGNIDVSRELTWRSLFGAASGRRLGILSTEWATPAAKADGRETGDVLYLQVMVETEDSVDVAPTDSLILFHLIDTTMVSSMKLRRPDGRDVTPDTASVYENIAYACDAVAHTLYSVTEPDSGKWTIIIENVNDACSLEVFGVNAPPTAALAFPPPGGVTGTSENVFVVTWTAEDPDAIDSAAVTIALYYDTNSTGFDGALITDTLHLGDTSFVFRPTGLESGNYYLYLVIDDSRSAPVYAYSPGALSLTNNSAPATPTFQAPVNGDQTVRVHWNANVELDIGGYVLYWGKKDSLFSDTLDVGNQVSYTVQNLTNDTEYKFALTAYDWDSNSSPMSTYVYGMPDEYGDIYAPDPPKEPLATILSGPKMVMDDQTEVSLTFGYVEDAAGYLVYYDRDYGLPYLGVDALEGPSPITVIGDTSITIHGLTEGATYYFAVSAYDAIGNTSPISAPISMVVLTWSDIDGDNLPDAWEILHFGSIEAVDDPNGDEDADLLCNLCEFDAGTDPNDEDTDRDKVVDGLDPNPATAADDDQDQMPDDWEDYQAVSDPQADPDADSLVNVDEFIFSTWPHDPDTDDDSFLDGTEVQHGTDPNDPASNPCSCPYQADFDGDGFVTALDLASEIDILFVGAEDTQDALCLTTRSDLDCDGFPTALDLSRLIDYLFTSGDGPCDPCAP